MKKVIAVLSIFSALIFSSQSFAQNGFGAGSSFSAPSFSGGGFVVEEGFQKPNFGSGAGFGKAGFVDVKDEDSENKESQASNTIGLQFMAGAGGGGGLFYKYQQPTSSKAPSYIFDAIGGLTLLAGERSSSVYVTVDNILYWNTTPGLDFLDLDLGINLRLGTVAFIFNPMFYLNANFTIPDTGVHFLLTTNIGTADFSNHDFKFSLAYEMDFLKSAFIPGIEFGGKIQHSSYPFFKEQKIVLGAYIGIYGKF